MHFIVYDGSLQIYKKETENELEGFYNFRCFYMLIRQWVIWNFYTEKEHA